MSPRKKTNADTDARAYLRIPRPEFPLRWPDGTLRGYGPSCVVDVRDPLLPSNFADRSLPAPPGVHVAPHSRADMAARYRMVGDEHAPPYVPEHEAVATPEPEEALMDAADPAADDGGGDDGP